MMARGLPWILLGGLALLAAGGALLLAQPVCTPADAREAEYFWAHHYWQCAFDALSAACGVGLLARDLAEGYSPTGRWVLAGLALLGALAYLLAVRAALARLGPSLFLFRAPRAGAVVIAFLAVVAVGSGATWLSRGSTAGGDVAGMVAGMASAGLAPAAAPPAPLAWLLTLGWVTWLVAAPAVARRYVRIRPVLIAVIVHTLLLAALAGVIALADAPRGAVTNAEPPAGPAQRYVEAANLVVLANGIGVSDRPLAGREASELTRVCVVLTLLLGGVAPGPGGGLTLLFACFVGVALVSGGGGTPREFARWTRAGLTAAAGLVVLTLAGAAGLLGIEQLAATRYTPAPAFTEACLDAASAVAGAGITGGLTETLTSRNLARGLRLPVNLYEVGMAWLMLLMLAGRVWPVLVLARLGAEEAGGEPSSRG